MTVAKMTQLLTILLLHKRVWEHVQLLAFLALTSHQHDWFLIEARGYRIVLVPPPCDDTLIPQLSQHSYCIILNLGSGWWMLGPWLIITLNVLGCRVEWYLLQLLFFFLLSQGLVWAVCVQMAPWDHWFQRLFQILTAAEWICDFKQLDFGEHRAWAFLNVLTLVLFAQ
jgi:hypothetical protein